METQVSPRLIVGLGNPAKSYHHTRHNIGRDYIDHLVEKTGGSFTSSRPAETHRLPDFFGIPTPRSIICAKLNRYMNESGLALQGLVTKERIAPDEVIVIIDDFMLPFGTIRLRPQGSAGGHNGLKSIIEVFGRDDIGRIRVGIGPVSVGLDPSHFVLRKFTATEMARKPTLFQVINEGLSILFRDGYQKAMAAMNKAHF